MDIDRDAVPEDAGPDTQDPAAPDDDWAGVLFDADPAGRLFAREAALFPPSDDEALFADTPRVRLPAPPDEAPAAATAPVAPGERAAARLRTAAATVARHAPAGIAVANPPLQRASTVLFDTLAQAEAAGAAAATGQRHASTYGTTGTDTTLALADAVSELEGGDAQAFRTALLPSGLAAIAAALMAFMKPGDHLLASDSIYGPARLLMEGLLADLGLAVTWFDPAIGQAGDGSTQFDPAPLAALVTPATRVIYMESPGSYTFEIQDVPAICAFARTHGLITMVDNAWASPLLARPFDWGVDVSIVPLTKHWGGHADVLMGAVTVREAHWLPLWRTVRQLGLCVGGDDAWLVLRGLRTVDVRLARHGRTALALAQWLHTHPAVARVLHPALPSHPQHALWKRDFTGACGLFSFELAGSVSREALTALCEGRRHFHIGYSWGGYESLIMPARLKGLRTVRPWEGGQLVRVHAGLEDVQDLADDLAQGFDAMSRADG